MTSHTLSETKPTNDPPAFQHRSFTAMGCTMTLLLDTADVTRAEAAFDAARAEVEDIEACLSRFRPTSELVSLNAQAGQWVSVSPVLGAVMRVALRAARITGGRCVPTMLDALEVAGYDRDFELLATALHTPGQPASSAPPARPDGPRGLGTGDARTLDARPARSVRQTQRRHLSRAAAARGRRAAWRAIRVTPASAGRMWVWVPRGVRLDLAGVAKGWTANRVANLLAPLGPCLVDAGGDLAARGAPAGLAGWPVAVANPQPTEADLALVLLRDAGIATSGTDFRHWSHHGHARHHLIDPHTGEPSRTDVLTATVIAGTATAADVHAKTALLLGVRRGLAYLAGKSLAGLLVRQDARVFTTRHWSNYALAT